MGKEREHWRRVSYWTGHSKEQQNHQLLVVPHVPLVSVAMKVSSPCPSVHLSKCVQFSWTATSIVGTTNQPTPTRPTNTDNSKRTETGLLTLLRWKSLPSGRWGCAAAKFPDSRVSCRSTIPARYISYITGTQVLLQSGSVEVQVGSDHIWYPVIRVRITYWHVYIDTYIYTYIYICTCDTHLNCRILCTHTCGSPYLLGGNCSISPPNSALLGNSPSTCGSLVIATTGLGVRLRSPGGNSDLSEDPHVSGCCSSVRISIYVYMHRYLCLRRHTNIRQTCLHIVCNPISRG